MSEREPEGKRCGTRYAWRTRGCRCAECRDWKARNQAAYRERHPDRSQEHETTRWKRRLARERD